MRLKYSSRTGHFNLLNPRQESISCHIAIYDDDNNRIISANISPEYELEGDDPEEIINAIKEYRRHTLSSADKEYINMIQFIETNIKEIEIGNKVYRKKEIEKQIQKLQSQLKQLL